MSLVRFEEKIAGVDFHHAYNLAQLPDIWVPRKNNLRTPT